MRQVFLEKGVVAVKEVAQPILEETAVLVQVHYSCISTGTEGATIANAQKPIFFSNVSSKLKKVLESVAVNGIDGTKALIKGRLQGQIVPIGYSCSGQVIAVGKATKTIKPGDWVACAGAGQANHADIVCVAENLVVKVTDPTKIKQASCTTIGAIALQGVRRAELALGETVAVIGLGLLGQLTVQLARASGCRVIGIDILDERLALAKHSGAHAVYNATDPSLLQDIAFLTGHHGVDSTIIAAASTSDALVQQAMEITRKKGKVVVVGDVGLQLQRSPLYSKEIDFLISCSYGPGRYDAEYEQKGHDYPYSYVRWTENRNMQAFVAMIESGQLDIDLLVSREMVVEDAPQAYESLAKKEGLGVILSYKHDAEVKSSGVSKQEQQGVRFVPAVKDTIRLGVIGAGGFAQVKLIPIVAQLKNVRIGAIVDAQISNAVNVARLYGVEHSFVDDEKLFEHDYVDAVMIASPHVYHGDQIIKSLSRGKAVFAEKPMVTTFEQLDHLRTFLQANPSSLLCVDYNRSFAPFIQTIKKTVAQRATPLVVQYRMNAGLIPKDHWVQTEVGAGRIIGEACHIVDLFYYLTDAQPVSVSVETIGSSHQHLFPTDNFSAHIRFSDGSLCSLLYTSVGHKQAGKERMEVFYDGKTIVMNDYTELRGFGLPSSFDQTVKGADKGHQELLTRFFSQLRAAESVMPISTDRLLSVANMTLVIDKLAREGGGQIQE